MRKKIILLIILGITCFIITGCKKEEQKKDGWTYNKTIIEAPMENEAKEAFNNAIKSYTGENLELVALLGQQVVAGTNYMYLCKGDTYKIVIVYKNLDNKSSITSVKEFDVNKYANQNIEYKNNSVSGGWYTEIYGTGAKLDDELQTSFEIATKKLPSVTYFPAALIATKKAEGKYFAILSYGVMETSYENSGVYLLTLYETPSGLDEIVSSAYVDLSIYNN